MAVAAFQHGFVQARLQAGSVVDQAIQRDGRTVSERRAVEAECSRAAEQLLRMEGVGVNRTGGADSQRESRRRIKRVMVACVRTPHPADEIVSVRIGDVPTLLACGRGKRLESSDEKRSYDFLVSRFAFGVVCTDAVAVGI